MPHWNRDAKNEHVLERINGARFFDIDKIADKSLNLPHMIPSLDDFNEFMYELGVKRTDDIICYDNIGIFSAPRVAFTFRYFGAERVRVLNGGFPKWKKEERKTVCGPPIPVLKGDKKDY